MIPLVLTIHVAGALVSLITATSLIRATLRSDRETARKRMLALTALMVFDGLTGVLLAILSATPAIATCDNIASYVAGFIGAIAFSTWYPARANTPRIPVLRPLLIGSILPFVPALLASLVGF